MTASPTPPAGELDVEITDDDVAFFRENGYFQVERITTDEEIDWLREVFDDLFGGPDPTTTAAGVYETSRPFGEEGEPSLTQLIRPEFQRPELLDTLLIRNARKIGARGLRMIIEDLMLDLMYNLPSMKKVKECVVTREVVLDREKPITLIEKVG